MNKQELIDKAVEQFEGVWRRDEVDFDRLVYTPNLDEHFKCWRCDWFNDGEWVELCTREEFIQRASELGWCNGYKYGVEYETNGKKPDLPCDVLVDLYIDPDFQYGTTGWLNESKTVESLAWDNGLIEKFRIMDERYKPIEPAPEKSWHEKGELPPVGSFVDVIGDVVYGVGEVNCEVIAHVENCAVIRMSYGLGCFESRVLRTTKSEREKFVEDAFIVAEKEGRANYKLIFAALFDAGFRAPK